MLFKFKPFEAPFRFTFKDPDTGREFYEPTKALLIDRITAYRAANNLEPLDHLGLILESYWCKLPENFGKCKQVDKLPRGAMFYMKGSMTLLKHVLYDKVVHKEVADKRAAQCIGCKFNVLPTDAGVMGWIKTLVTKTTEGLKSAFHNELGQCNACGCFLQSKVFYSGVIEVDKPTLEKLKEVNCWQLEHINGR